MLNVNGYEVDNIPIKIADDETFISVKEQVQELLINPNNIKAFDKLNALVYKIYGLTEEEQTVVEQRY